MKKTHIVRSGECLSSIAHDHGFRNWKTLYDHPDNADFKQKRPNPNVIYPGDVLVIPERAQRTEDANTQKRHRYRARGEPWVFRIEMKDEQGNGIEDEPFVFTAPGNINVLGRTKAKGLIEVEMRGHVRSARLEFLGGSYEVRFGDLDPIGTVKGVQERLNNLGFRAGPVDGIVGPQTRKAVYEFQKTQSDLEATGGIDDATRRRLLEFHDNDTRLTPAEEDMSEVDAAPTQAEPASTGQDPPPDAVDRSGESLDWNPTIRSYEYER
jgi:hypothetical protein